MYVLTYGKTKIYEWLEQKAVKKQFYSNERFKKLDQILLSNYRYKSPYYISKQYLKEKGAGQVHVYGETPLTTMEKIVREFGIKKTDTILEMGAGRGRTSLFLGEFVGAKVIAYELIPEFVKKMVPSPNVEMHTGDMFTADFSKVDGIYLYGTMLDDEEILALCEAFPKGVKIITVSYPLKEYSELYQTKNVFMGRFPWGQTEVFLNERTR